MKKILATMMALALAIGAQAQNDSILIRGDVRDNFTNAEITSGRAYFLTSSPKKCDFLFA